MESLNKAFNYLQSIYPLEWNIPNPIGRLAYCVILPPVFLLWLVSFLMVILLIIAYYPFHSIYNFIRYGRKPKDPYDANWLEFWFGSRK